VYTLLELQAKTLGELKKIGYELNVLPEGDRRRRQSWIDALVPPPLLRLLEVSPGVEVEQVQEAIEEAAKTSPGVDVDPAQKPIMETVKTSPGVDVDLIEMQLQEPLVESSPGAHDCPFCGAQHGLFVDKDHLDRFVIRCLHCSYSRFKNYLGAIRTLAQEAVLVSKLDSTVYPKLAANPIMGTAETSPAASVEQVQEAIEVQAQEPPLESKFGRIVYPRPAQETIAQTAETSPGVDLVEDELPRCSNCFGDGYIEDEFGFVKFCQCETEPRLSHKRTQRAIEPATKNLPGSRSKTSLAHQLLDLFKSSAHIIEDSPGVKAEATVKV
jgi:hypothetical protein